MTPISEWQWRDVRRLWNEWDPIGVGPEIGGPADEYDSYLGPTLRLLEQRASVDELEQYLAQVTLQRMGLPESPRAETSRRRFAMRLSEWYEVQR